MKDQMDMMREITSIAAAHGSRALSQMLGKRINLTMPKLEALDTVQFEAAIPLDQVVISVQTKILSGISGNIILMLDEQSAFELVGICCPQPVDGDGMPLTEMGFSVLKEIGNVVSGAFCGALSIILKNPVIPSIPMLISGPFGDIIRSLASPYQEKEYVILVEACFEEEKKQVKGGLYFIVPVPTMTEIQEACKRLLDEV